MHFVHVDIDTSSKFLVLGVILEQSSDATVYEGNMGKIWLDSLQSTAAASLATDGKITFTGDDLFSEQIHTYEMLQWAFSGSAYHFQGS